MAIYKNREVHVVGPNVQANTPESINIQYKDGSHENVKLTDVKFTKDEKNALVKNHPSKYDNVATIEDADLEAVRVGVAPPSDPTYKEQAELKARNQKQKDLNDKQTKAAEDNAKKNIDNEVDGQSHPSPVVRQPIVATQPVTTSTTPNFVVPNQNTSN
jgi:hypothetical protein